PPTMRPTSYAFRIAAAIMALGAALAARAQGAPPIAIKGARLVVGDGSVVENPVIVVTGDRITAVGPASKVVVPAGARGIDLGVGAILPGRIGRPPHNPSARKPRGGKGSPQGTRKQPPHHRPPN